MNAARLQSVLLDADGPLIVLLRDLVETAWIGSAIESSPEGEAFLCVPISEARVSAFRHGDVDLRSLFTNPQIATPARILLGSLGTVQYTELVPVIEIEPDWLPDAGFLLTTFIQPVASEFRAMAAEAANSNRVILYLNLNPPEARARRKIDADRLGQALTLFQKNIKHAQSVATRFIRNIDERRKTLLEDSFKFEVFAFALNSFEVHLQAKTEGDIFGHSAHVHALEKLDEIARVVNDTEAAVGVAKANRGHFVTGIRDLMEFVALSDTPLSYAWTVPQSGTVHAWTINPEPAQRLYEALANKEELTRQEVVFVGRFSKIDEKFGKWRLTTLDGEDLSGSTSDDVDISWIDTRIKSRVYELRCVEVLSEAEVSGEQRTRLELSSQPRIVTDDNPDEA